MDVLEKTKNIYNEVFQHLQDSADELYKAGFDNSLLYREINCLMDFITDIL